MKRNMKTLLVVGVSGLLLAGCCTAHRSNWEYKVTAAPQSPEEVKNMQAPSLANREKYLDGLGAEGWVLVSSDQGVYYLKRRK